MKIDKSWYIKPQNARIRVGAGGVVVRKVGEKVYIALIKDKKFEHFMLPKGGVEKGEEVVVAAKREIQEETGLNEINLVGKLGVKERLSFEKDRWAITHYFLFTTTQEKGEQNLQAGEEDLIVEWFDIDQLLPLGWPEQKEVIDENLGKIKKSI